MVSCFLQLLEIEKLHPIPQGLPQHGPNTLISGSQDRLEFKYWLYHILTAQSQASHFICSPPSFLFEVLGTGAGTQYTRMFAIVITHLNPCTSPALPNLSAYSLLQFATPVLSIHTVPSIWNAQFLSLSWFKPPSNIVSAWSCSSWTPS